MINGNDVQLFYKLLDSLSASLRDLVVKYELLVAAGTRSSQDKEKGDAAVTSLAKEVTISFSSIIRDVENLKVLASEGRESDAKLITHVQALVKSVETLDSKLTLVASDASAARTNSMEGKDVAVHVDSHMDGFGTQLAIMQTMLTELSKISVAIDDMKKQVEPFKKLAILFSKPMSIILGIYVIFTTIIAFMEGCSQIEKAKEKINNQSGRTNMVSTTSEKAVSVQKNR